MIRVSYGSHPSYGYHTSKVIFNITGQIHKFSLTPKIWCYRLAYCSQNIRSGLKFLYAIIRSYVQCWMYIIVYT